MEKQEDKPRTTGPFWAMAMGRAGNLPPHAPVVGMLTALNIIRKRKLERVVAETMKEYQERVGALPF